MIESIEEFNLIYPNLKIQIQNMLADKNKKKINKSFSKNLIFEDMGKVKNQEITFKEYFYEQIGENDKK